VHLRRWISDIPPLWKIIYYIELWLLLLVWSAVAIRLNSTPERTWEQILGG
jgi:hypothetical protein